MYYVLIYDGCRYRQLNEFKSFDKALSFIEYNYIVHDIPLCKYRISHNGMVITLNENTLKKVFK